IEAQVLLVLVRIGIVRVLRLAFRGVEDLAAGPAEPGVLRELPLVVGPQEARDSEDAPFRFVGTLVAEEVKDDRHGQAMGCFGGAKEALCTASMTSSKSRAAS